MRGVLRWSLLISCRFDPSKFILEHYVDGDLVNCETPITKNAASPDGLHIWGKFVSIAFEGVVC